MQADEVEVTQHQPEETIRPPDGKHMTDEEYEEFKHWKEDMDVRLSTPRPNVLKATLTNVTGGLHFLLTNIELPLAKQRQLWCELQDVLDMLDVEIAKQFAQK